MNLKAVEYSDHWLLPVAGRVVTRHCVDAAFGIEFWELDYELSIRIEGEFVVVLEGTEYRLDPEKPGSLGPALTLLNREARSGVVDKGGTLTIVFQDESILTVAPDNNFEAWELVGTGGLRFVCMPGGEVAVWNS